MCLTLCHSNKGSNHQSTRIYNTRANQKKRMDHLEQENKELREKMTSMQAEMEKLTALVNALMAAQNQASVSQPTSTVLESVVSVILVSTMITSTPQRTIPEGFPWGMANMFNGGFRPIVSIVLTSIPHPTMPKGYPWDMSFGFTEEFRPVVSEFPTPSTQQSISVSQPGAPIPQVAMTYIAPFVHTIHQDYEHVFHSENVEASKKGDDWPDKLNKIQREVKALRGKDLFGQNAPKLCLVPNVVIPPKFKVPIFEKYKGDSCPRPIW